jgi:hypothetical protein
MYTTLRACQHLRTSGFHTPVTKRVSTLPVSHSVHGPLGRASLTNHSSTSSVPTGQHTALKAVQRKHAQGPCTCSVCNPTTTNTCTTTSLWSVSGDRAWKRMTTPDTHSSVHGLLPVSSTSASTTTYTSASTTTNTSASTTTNTSSYIRRTNGQHDYVPVLEHEHGGGRRTTTPLKTRQPMYNHNHNHTYATHYKFNDSLSTLPDVRCPTRKMPETILE